MKFVKKNGLYISKKLEYYMGCMGMEDRFPPQLVTPKLPVMSIMTPGGRFGGATPNISEVTLFANHNFEAPFDGGANLDGYSAEAGTVTAGTTSPASGCGSQYMSCDASGDSLAETFTATDIVYTTFLFRTSALPSVGNTAELLRLGSTITAYIDLYNNSGTTNVRGLEAQNWNIVTSTVAISTNTWYQVRLYFKCVAAGNGEISIRVRDISGAWSEATVEDLTCGVTKTATVNYHEIGNLSLAATMDFDWHKASVSGFPNDPA